MYTNMNFLIDIAQKRSMRWQLLLFVFWFGIIENSLAQDQARYVQRIYYTPKGVIQINAQDADSLISIKGSYVSIILNYETAHFVMRFDANTLSTGVDSLDHILGQMEQFTVRYKGHFELNYIKTEKHLAQDFEVTGRLEIGGNDYGELKGKGRIEHVVKSTYPCLLNLTFTINKDDLEKELELPIPWETLQVEVNQAILDKEF